MSGTLEGSVAVGSGTAYVPPGVMKEWGRCSSETVAMGGVQPGMARFLVFQKRREKFLHEIIRFKNIGD